MSSCTLTCGHQCSAFGTNSASLPATCSPLPVIFDCVIESVTYMRSSVVGEHAQCMTTAAR